MHTIYSVQMKKSVQTIIIYIQFETCNLYNHNVHAFRVAVLILCGLRIVGKVINSTLINQVIEISGN